MFERTVSVSASGHVSAVPDSAAINTGVQTEADTARDAMTRNTAVMGKLIDGLKGAGIATVDIQTTAISINPRYTQPRDGKQPTISGYYAQNQVRIHVRDIQKLGETLDTALSLGATQLGGIAFEVSAAETLKDEARKLAVANARRRAELYAAAAGASLGQVVTISESVQMSTPQPMLGTRARMMAADAVPVEAGSVQLDATIHMTWVLK